ncbi:3-ketodihydrosphingosine reductase tsc10 [Dictyocoela muelleri]|nr:3-ketodihydrosphingosine reductase tsc10 [Dictyocoela muelleri]
MFETQKILIIGGTKGLGLSLAIQLKESGADVTITGRSKYELKKLKRIFGFKIKIFDVTKFRNIRDNVKNNKIKSKISSIEKFNNTLGNDDYDLIFYCVGYCRAGYFKDLSIDDYKNQMEVNYLGAIKCLKHFHNLRNRENGANPVQNKLHNDERKKHNRNIIISRNKLIKPLTFVMIGSTLSVTSIPGYSAYSTSKTALKSLFDNLYLELLKEKISLKIFLVTNMMTEGFINENKTKPEFTKKIDNYGKPLCPDYAAKLIIDKIYNNQICFYKNFGPFLPNSGESIIVSDLFTEFFLIKSEFSGLRQFILIPFAVIFYWCWKNFLTIKFLAA